MYFVFPPNESCSSLVNFESLYGTKLLFASTNADITFPSADSDKLIFVASFRVSPLAPVLLCRSLPAKSTMFSFPTRMWPSVPVSIVIVKMECDREDYARTRR